MAKQRIRLGAALKPEKTEYTDAVTYSVFTEFSAKPKYRKAFDEFGIKNPTDFWDKFNDLPQEVKTEFNEQSAEFEALPKEEQDKILKRFRSGGKLIREPKSTKEKDDGGLIYGEPAP